MCVLALGSAAGAAEQAGARYRDARLPVEERVADLLSRMTLEEKTGQLLHLLGWEMYTKTGGGPTVSARFERAVKERHVGALWGLLRADPWTQRTLATGLWPKESAEAVNALQRYAIENSRLGIPLLLAEECPHGHMAIGATVFPTSIGQAATWDPALIGRMAQAVAAETRATGATIGYGPVLDLAREPRWSRVEEGYGEDPVLASRMGEAVVRGFQGATLASPDAILSTLKHFAAHGIPEGGHNSAAAHVGPRELETMHLAAFRAAIRAGAGSLMSSYNEIDGIPCSANKALLTGLLRKQWGFRGFVVSDLGAIPALAGAQHVAAGLKEAAALSLAAGVDSDLGGDAYATLPAAVRAGLVSEAALDEAVRRVLRAKFALGLFENPYADPARAAHVTGSKEYQELARQVARESIILLKNAAGALPLRMDLASLAVIGPNADSVYNQLGDYTAPQPAGKVVTVLEGIRNKVGAHTLIRYAKGCGIRDTSEAGFAEALDAVRQSDVAVVVLGGSSARDFATHFEQTGAARPSDGSDMESGEGFDRATLDLAGVQMKLLERIAAAGKPLVLVLIKGRPLLLNWPAAHVPAILDAWYPGEQGGNAIADVLFGDYNPAGRLAISVPKAVGQLPVFYNTASEPRSKYIDLDAAPLYPFGYGLSYTRFAYDHLRVEVAEPAAGARVSVSLDVTNTGERAGDEVVQLYLRDLVASVTTPVKALKAFRRITLKPGEKQSVRFELTAADLAVLNPEMRWVVEPGWFEAQAGASSDDIRQKARFEIKTAATLP
jgi:beta-glucosidase